MAVADPSFSKAENSPRVFWACPFSGNVVVFDAMHKLFILRGSLEMLNRLCSERLCPSKVRQEASRLHRSPIGAQSWFHHHEGGSVSPRIGVYIL